MKTGDDEYLVTLHHIKLPVGESLHAGASNCLYYGWKLQRPGKNALGRVIYPCN